MRILCNYFFRFNSIHQRSECQLVQEKTIHKMIFQVVGLQIFRNPFCVVFHRRNTILYAQAHNEGYYATSNNARRRSKPKHSRSLGEAQPRRSRGAISPASIVRGSSTFQASCLPLLYQWIKRKLLKIFQCGFFPVVGLFLNILHCFS